MCLEATILSRAALEFWTKTMGSQEQTEQWREAMCISPLWILSALECTKWAKGCMTAFVLYSFRLCVQWCSLQEGYWIIHWTTIPLVCEWSLPSGNKDLRVLVPSGERSWGEGTVLAISVFGIRGILVNFGTINDDGDLEIGYRIKNTEGWRLVWNIYIHAFVCYRTYNQM